MGYFDVLPHTCLQTISKSKSTPTPQPSSLPPEVNVLKPSTSHPIGDTRDSRAGDYNKRRLRKEADLGKTQTRKGKSNDENKSLGMPFLLGDNPSQDKHAELEDSTLFNDIPGYLGPRTSADLRYEVTLTALVRPRKPRKRKVEGDFEMVPPVRPVIALDDVIAPELVIDEPWEHIYGSDDDNEYEPSYATITTIASPH